MNDVPIIPSGDERTGGSTGDAEVEGRKRPKPWRGEAHRDGDVGMPTRAASSSILNIITDSGPRTERVFLVRHGDADFTVHIAKCGQWYGAGDTKEEAVSDATIRMHQQHDLGVDLPPLPSGSTTVRSWRPASFHCSPGAERP
jgi:hypothetical protein